MQLQVGHPPMQTGYVRFLTSSQLIGAGLLENMATIMYPSLQKSQSMRAKRKSAVELLAESKAFYVKSEIVRDNQQALPLRLGSGYVPVRAKAASVSIPQQQVTHGSGWRPASMPQCRAIVASAHAAHHAACTAAAAAAAAADMAVSPSRSLPPLRVTGRRSTSACSDVLQNKLRKLLNGDSRENVSGTCSSDDRLIDEFMPISPPAEYAITERSSYRWRDAQSCSPERRVVHKSLPDLHRQQQQRHQQQQQRESCSNKSASNKSLSNRDSGESSGHYTHRSEPAPPPPPLPMQPPWTTSGCGPDVRRDSGSSTQHSGASGSAYPPYACDPTGYGRTTRLGYPPLVPPPPQDDRYRQPAYEYSSGAYQDPTLSPGPGTFKRQKCFRYKQRSDRGCAPQDQTASRPILRSKSDISDRYWRCGAPPPSQQSPAQPPALSHLEQFFEQLGLNSDSYESMLMEGECDTSSPVYFSDVSTVDSTRPLDAGDYCTAPPFRPSDPPSIVERNARIIKWLCNCRKLQITNS